MIALSEARVREIVREELAGSEFQAFLNAIKSPGKQFESVPEAVSFEEVGPSEGNPVSGGSGGGGDGGSHGANVFLESHDPSVEEGAK